MSIVVTQGGTGTAVAEKTCEADPHLAIFADGSSVVRGLAAR